MPDDLLEFFQKAGKRTLATTVGRGVVKEINGQLCTLTRKGEADLLNVSLVAIEDGVTDKLLITPKVGSVVAYAMIDKTDDAVVIAFSEIDKVTITIGTATFEVSANGFKITRGNANAKTIIKNIIESDQQIMVLYGNNPDYGKLATALADLNNLLL